MIPTPNYYPIEGGAWMTLRELEGLGSWDYYSVYREDSDTPALVKVSAYSALCAVGRDGGFAMPSNGMHVKISNVDLTALLGEMANHGPTPSDGNAS